MLIVLSPAKTLDLEPATATRKMTQPEFLDEANMLNSRLQKLSRSQLATLMGISDKLAAGVHDYVKDWQLPFTAKTAKPAALTFVGDVYQGLGARDFKARDLDFAQKHLRILSGLYGVLRPLDLMQAYRLEMGTALSCKSGAKNARFDGLYDFWGDKIAGAINDALEQQGDQILVNLASNEYFKAAKRPNLEARIVTPVFRDAKNGQYKVISFFAKKARGRMARHIITNRLKRVEDLETFNADGYRFSANLSSGDELVFTRKAR